MQIEQVACYDISSLLRFSFAPQLFFIFGSRELSAPMMTGFYSYGKLAPFNRNSLCELHNQTMTITTFGES